MSKYITWTKTEGDYAWNIDGMLYSIICARAHHFLIKNHLDLDFPAQSDIDHLCSKCKHRLHRTLRHTCRGLV